MTNKSISEQLIETAEECANCVAALALNPSEINAGYADKSKELFKQLAQQVEGDIHRLENTLSTQGEATLKWSDAHKKREQLWLELDSCYRIQHPTPKAAYDIQELRKQLGLE